jgi:hypothetical protein
MATPVFFGTTESVGGNPAALEHSITLINGDLNAHGISPEALIIEPGVYVEGSGYISDTVAFSFQAFPGPFSLTNDGTILANFAGQDLDVTTDGLTNESDGTIGAQDGGTLSVSMAGAETWTNIGTISEVDATVELGSAFINAGTISAAGGELDLGDSRYGNTSVWSNTGTIDTDKTRLVLEGDMTTAGIGTIDHRGGTYLLNGTIDNTGAVLDLSSGTFEGLTIEGTISGGTLMTGANGSLAVDGATLSNVTIDTDAASVTPRPGDVTLTGLVRIDSGTGLGAITLGTGSSVQLPGVSEIVDDPSLTASPTGVNMLDASAVDLVGGDIGVYQPYSPNQNITPALTIESGATVSGFGQIDGAASYSPHATIVNYGTIAATVAGEALTIGGVADFANHGTLTASDDGILSVGSPYSTNGAVTLAADGTVSATGASIDLDQTFVNDGTITVDDGALVLGVDVNATGTWNNAGTITTNDTAITLKGNTTTAAVETIQRTGGSITLVSGATLTNTG